MEPSVSGHHQPHYHHHQHHQHAAADRRRGAHTNTTTSAVLIAITLFACMGAAVCDSSSSSSSSGSLIDLSGSSGQSTPLYDSSTGHSHTPPDSSTGVAHPPDSSTGVGHHDSSTGDGSQIIPGGSIGKGGSWFGSTDAVFLTTVLDVWIDIILWTMVFTAIAFLGASIQAIRLYKSVRYMWVWLPPLMMAFGAIVGFVHGSISAALIGAASIAIPYPVGIDIAAGLGIGQAICIIYFHLGRADFIHR